ncbi:MAG TPA: AbfB domain-containing protein [Spirochaetota bacterium]|nr:AbfB domain-containing protein [Spirochaetota bacterium]
MLNRIRQSAALWLIKLKKKNTLLFKKKKNKYLFYTAVFFTAVAFFLLAETQLMNKAVYISPLAVADSYLWHTSRHCYVKKKNQINNPEHITFYMTRGIGNYRFKSFAVKQENHFLYHRNYNIFIGKKNKNDLRFYREATFKIVSLPDKKGLCALKPYNLRHHYLGVKGDRLKLKYLKADPAGISSVQFRIIPTLINSLIYYTCLFLLLLAAVCLLVLVVKINRIKA